MGRLAKGEERYKDRYRYRYKDEAGKWKAVYGKTLEELREKEEGLRQNGLPNNRILLKDQIRYYLGTLSLKESTEDTYSKWADSIAHYPIMSKPIKDIRSSEVKMWIKTLSNDGYSQSTINGYYTGLIKPAFQLAVDDELIIRNPAQFKLTSVVKSKPTRMGRALTKSEEERFRDYLDNSNDRAAKINRDLLIFTLETGLRAAEVSGLTVDDVNFDDNCITVRKQLVYKARLNYIRDLKTESSERTVPLTSAARQALQNAIDNMPEEGMTIDGYSGFIFTGRNGQPLTRNNLSHKYKVVADNLGIKGTTFHSLRHTFCSNLVRRKLPPKTIQVLMGHASIKTTMDVYAHVEKEELFKALLDE